jgi:anaerobic selenocysteine-containing dehydrogenase
MRFSPATIDKAGKQVAEALHGRWMAPVSGYDEPDVALLVGINPPIAYQGTPRGNPTVWLRKQADRGMQLLVIDPRNTETARLAKIHLQPLPGHDAALLAAMLHVVLAEELYDHEFVVEHVAGLDDLRRVVDRFTPESAARDADIGVEELIAAARVFGAARRGYVSVGTGPNMAGPGTLVEYLALCLDTLGGHVARAGDVVRNAATLLPTPVYRAQMSSPKPAVGLNPVLDQTGLTSSIAGPPVAGLSAEMSRRDGRQVRALISCGGNPASAWPDQRAVVDALRGLELLVQVDPWMSNTSRLADYIIAPTMALEVADMSQHLDSMTQLSIGYGLADSYAQYTPAIAEVPPGSEVVEEWRFFFDLARAMGLELEITRPGRDAVKLDMQAPPSTEELLDLLAEGSRVPLNVVRAANGGALYPAPIRHVQPRESGWSGRADLGNALMMLELESTTIMEQAHDPALDLRLIPRRVQHVYNSSAHHAETARGGSANRAHMHPDDLAERGVEAGEEVVVRSAIGQLTVVAAADRHLRRGVVSMTHCYGGLPDEHPGTDPDGANLGLVVGFDHLQPHTGQPVMSNVPVSVTRAAMTEASSVGEGDLAVPAEHRSVDRPDMPGDVGAFGLNTRAPSGSTSSTSRFIPHTNPTWEPDSTTR